MKKSVAVSGLIASLSIAAQDTTQKASPLTFSDYAEACYGYDFNRPADNHRPPFAYSLNRHKEATVPLPAASLPKIRLTLKAAQS